MIDAPHWFADVDPEQPEPYQWQPCLETHTGHIPCFDVWFPTREACEDWIREFVIGAGLETDLRNPQPLTKVETSTT